MKTKAKKKHILKENIRTIVVGGITITIVLVGIIYNNYFNTDKTYTVVNGYVEKLSDTFGYVLKNEQIVEINSDSVAIPIVEQDKRVSNGEVIAIYQNDQYDEYLTQIDQMDKEIQTLIGDLPSTYSNDVAAIDEQIEKLVKESNDTTSYVKMQEYKNKIDELAYKKVTILGDLSPAGSKIRELIEERESVEANKKNLGNSIKATMSGLVTYKIDELENVVSYDEILTYNVDTLDNIIEKYSANNENNFGIKIIDNYNCYLLVKEARSENDIYIKKGKRYNIKLLDKNSESISGLLESNIQTDEYNYCIFSLNNGIENIADNRVMNIEVVWTKVNGMAVPQDAIYKNEEKDYEYVTIVYGGEYTDVPVKTVISNENLSIVENLTDEEKSEKGIQIDYILEVYDQLLIQNIQI